MKNVLVVCAVISFSISYGQSDRFRPGYMVDKSGEKYEGFIRFEPGTDKAAGTVIFREGKKGKKESYSTTYVKSFKVEGDSFVILKQIPMPGKKVKAEDFARVVLTGPGGIIYQLEYDKAKESGHAATEFKTIEENSKYYLQINGKLAMLTQTNFRDIATIVSDCSNLRDKITSKKVKIADLEKVVEEYSICTSKHSATNQ